MEVTVRKKPRLKRLIVRQSQRLFTEGGFIFLMSLNRKKLCSMAGLFSKKLESCRNISHWRVYFLTSLNLAETFLMPVVLNMSLIMRFIFKLDCAMRNFSHCLFMQARNYQTAELMLGPYTTSVAPYFY